MESPFLDIPVREIKNYNLWNNNEDEIMVKSPLIDPDLHKIETEGSTDFEAKPPYISSYTEIMDEDEADSNFLLNQFYSPSPEQEFDFGSFIKSAAGWTPSGVTGTQNISGYEDPNNSGNPLIKIDSTNRRQKLSKNFTVEDFARAAGGKYKWSYYRVDMELINELQRVHPIL